MLFKLFWITRALVYKILLFKKLGFISYIGRPLFFTGLRRVSAGKRFRLYPHWRIEVLQHGSIKIGEDVSAGQGLHLVALATELRIGRGTVISTNVLITNSDHDYKELGVPIYKQPMINKVTKIGDNCFIGAGAKILAGTQLGNQCIVGANAVVKGNFPDFCVIAGNPARVIKRFDVESQRWLNLPD
ncbi:acyltransferase [Pantoea sp. FN060301]|uniref:acyltransferase n=1 Tax=Pantoea sp. FN060301 TaxID=3420380 RepID=UPI003D16DCA3